MESVVIYLASCWCHLNGFMSDPRNRWAFWLLTSASLHTGLSLSMDRPLDITLLFTLADVLSITAVAYLWQHICQLCLTQSFALLNALFSSAVLSVCMLAAALLYLLASLAYPVTPSHSLIWAISAASGMLSLSSCITLGRASLPVLPRKRGWKWAAYGTPLVLTMLMSLAYMILSTLFMSYITDVILLLSVLMISVIASLYFSAIQTSCYIIFCALTISISTLYDIGPLAHLTRTENRLMISQLYLLILTLMVSAGFSRVSDLKNAQRRGSLLVSCLKTFSFIRGFYRFSYYPDHDQLTWHDVFTEEKDDVAEIASMTLLTGRFHESEQDALRSFLVSQERSSGYSEKAQLFQGEFLNKNLQYIPVSLAFLTAETRYGSLHYEGVLIIR